MKAQKTIQTKGTSSLPTARQLTLTELSLQVCLKLKNNRLSVSPAQSTLCIKLNAELLQQNI